MWILVIFAAVIVISFISLLAMTKIRNHNDMIYLEFLIDKSTINKVNEKSIREKILEYRGKPYIDLDKLDELEEKFKKKFA